MGCGKSIEQAQDVTAVQPITLRDSSNSVDSYEASSPSTPVKGKTHAGRQSSSRRHIVLHFDINKTIVMLDSVAGKSAIDIANHTVASCSWGRGTTQADWQCAGLEPCVDRPRLEFISYIEMLDAAFPGKELRAAHDSLAFSFTEPGQPGAAMRPHVDAFLTHLQLPECHVGSNRARGAGESGADLYIIPAFFELLLELRRRGQSFALVFRTFGEDLERVALEFNAFCEGRHPLFPTAVLDGRDGSIDYRLDLADPGRVGTFFRHEKGVALILGTLRQPTPNEGLAFYQEATFSHTHIVESTGESFKALHTVLSSLTNSCGTTALRDYFPFWKEKEKSCTAGKLLLIDREPCAPQQIFFDDNIEKDRPKIVHALDVRSSKCAFENEYLNRYHIVRVDPWEAVFDRHYFLHHVERLFKEYSVRMSS